MPLNDRFKDMKWETTVTSGIPENIPLKAAREFSALLKKMPLTCRVTGILDDGSAVISAGQWHGLESGKYSTDAGEIEITNITRYSSSASGVDFSRHKTLTFKLFPDLDKFLNKINYEIKENAVKVYGTDETLNKRDGTIKESIQGTCVINQGASFCLPGYGSFLSIDYMGIENGAPDYPGIFLTASLTALHLGLVPLLTDFEVKFLPWMNDRGRTNQMKRLNYYLWCSIPFTFTASFYSQLAYNYREKMLLPPQFADHDQSAAVISIFVPGGGMFYKGYRWTGWGVYLGELSLAGYAVYTGDKQRRNLAAGSLALLKLAEIAVSYFIPPSYSFFNREISASDNIDFSIGVKADDNGNEEITAGLSFRY
jgi:hypothetical protein